MSQLYIERQICLDDEVLTEAELLRQSNLIVVLAEPGAGKSDLLANLAKSLGIKSVRAAIFRTSAYLPAHGPLVIDAMDEVARIGEAELNDIIVKASKHFMGTVIFATRSGVWETARTKFVEDCFGVKPTLAHLQAFTANEQRQLFKNWFPSEKFDDFAQEAHRFDLTPLLGNPEFLQLFGLAYKENNRRFSSKAQIYADAAKRLAHESNEGVSTRGRPDAALMVKQAGTIFARLLLSGASGISLKEKFGDQNYPYAEIVIAEANGGFQHLLDSRLFKPAGDANQHEPVHRIMAEFLAAQYFADRIGDPGDRLSLKRTLALIAPNGVVRDELRGLLGWLAALGGDAVQRAAVAIDPYAVLGNGDPAQLSAKNKMFLIDRLQTLAKSDPFFRRSDSWRSFNVGQFFTDDTIGALRPLLASREESHLRGLIIELVRGTPTAGNLAPELRNLVLDPKADEYERLAAYKLLLEIEAYDALATFDPLLKEASPTSLQMITRLVTKHGTDELGFEKVIALLRALTLFYPKGGRGYHRGSMSRYFLKEFFREFPASGIAEYLDELAAGIKCTCAPKRSYACECRYSISKIVGGLLDRHFEVDLGPHDPARVWGWTKNLRFPGAIKAEDSASVRVLSMDDELRQAMQQVAFADAKTSDELRNVEMQLYFSHAHGGVHFREQDLGVLIQSAFQSGRPGLWETLWRPHNVDRDLKGPQAQRTLMRAQARENTDFMKAWARRERAAQLDWSENRRHWANRSKRYARREAESKAKTLAHLRDNRTLIEAGEHWPWLRQFSHQYLHKPEKLTEIIDDIEIAHKALRNCFPFLAPHAPTLETLAKRERTGVASALHAACLLRWRETGTLDGISLDMLRAVKTESGISSGVEEEEANAFEAELDRLLFQEPAEIEKFARDFIEPSLSCAPDAVTNVQWLDYRSPFQELRAKLPLEWLKRFPNMPVEAETALFKMAARHGPRADVRALIAERVNQYLPALPTDAKQETINRRNFWLLNSFFHNADEGVWNILKADKNSLLGIANRTDQFGDTDDRVSPPLSADKLYDVLDSFVGRWPEVELPSTYGTGDPPGEVAYRFLSEIPWRIAKDAPEKALAVYDKLSPDPRFAGFLNDLLAARATVARRLAHGDYRAPSAADVAALLEKRSIASVEDMRALMLEALSEVESQIRYAETDTIDTFYTNGTHVDENTARNRIVEHLRSYMTAHRLSVVIEHHMAQGNRCDITATEMIAGRRRLLTIEVKGQWHGELFTAASAQLDKRYSSNPDAEQQGIYLILWFGPHVEVAGTINTKYKTSEALREAIVEAMPAEMRGRIDVKMADLSRAAVPSVAVRPRKSRVRKKPRAKKKALKAKP